MGGGTGEGRVTAGISVNSGGIRGALGFQL
jgi:hypothetical protein